MIRQDDSRFSENPNIKEFACVLFQYLYLGNKLAAFSLGIPEIKALIDIFEQKGWLSPTMDVNEPDQILAYMGMDAEAVRAESSDYIFVPGEYGFRMWSYTDATGKLWSHAIGDDGNGHQTYDPLGRSHCGRLGKPTDCRVFKLRGAM